MTIQFLPMIYAKHQVFDISYETEEKNEITDKNNPEERASTLFEEDMQYEREEFILRQKHVLVHEGALP